MVKKQGLEYEAQEPAFLRRLKQGHAALDGRHNVQIPRARGISGKNGRLNMDGEDGEDDPIVLDESGNVVSKDEMEAMKKDDLASETAIATTVAIDVSNSPQSENRPIEGKTHVVHSGFGKKRKAVKVVGEDEGVDNAAEDGAIPIKTLTESTKDLRNVVTKNKEEAKTEGTKRVKKKKLKLSFEEHE